MYSAKKKRFYHNLLLRSSKVKQAVNEKITKVAGGKKPAKDRNWTTKNLMWTIIKENNAEAFTELLKALPDDKKDALLNGQKIITPQPKENEPKPKSYLAKLKKRAIAFLRGRKAGLQDESRPLFQCVLFGSFDVLRVLLGAGADVLQAPENRWNILHYLVIVSHENKKYEERAVHIYNQLLNELEETDIKALLMMEDKEGLRPLELAVHASCLQLFNAMINTSGVYLVNRERKGLKEISWYDITEYEHYTFCKKSRCSKSPVQILAFSDRRILQTEASVKILRKGMLKQWTKRKWRVNLPFILIWFLIRFVSIVGFFFMISTDMKSFLLQAGAWVTTYYCSASANVQNSSTDGCFQVAGKLKGTGNFSHNDSSLVHHRNKTDECEPFQSWYLPVSAETTNLVPALVLILFYLMVYLACSILYDFTSVLFRFCSRDRQWIRVQGAYKDVVVSITFYRVCHCTFALWASLILCGYITETFLNMPLIDVKYGTIMTCFFSIWSLLYFVQLIPSIGQFVNSIRRLLEIMANFIIVYMLMIFPYPHGFMLLLKDKDDSCKVAGFESLVSGFYTSFKIMLNMVDLTEYSMEAGMQECCDIFHFSTKNGKHRSEDRCCEQL